MPKSKVNKKGKGKESPSASKKVVTSEAIPEVPTVEKVAKKISYPKEMVQRFNALYQENGSTPDVYVVVAKQLKEEFPQVFTDALAKNIRPDEDSLLKYIAKLLLPQWRRKAKLPTPRSLKPVPETKSEA